MQETQQQLTLEGFPWVEEEAARDVPRPATVACRSCGARIFWVRAEGSGKLAPIDAEPSPRGNCLVDFGQAIYRVLTGQTLASHVGELYLNHFATCPNREAHRKAQNKR